MTIREGEYEVDRERLVRWASLSGQLKRLALQNLEDNLIMSSEHIITENDLLKYMHVIPGRLFDNVSSDNNVHYKCVKIIFNKKEIV